MPYSELEIGVSDPAENSFKSASPMFPPELEIGSKPVIVAFNDGDQKSHTAIDPFDVDHRSFKVDTPLLLEGKQCWACLHGEWLFMFDEGTTECFLLSLTSMSKISLPPLLLTMVEVDSLCRCALSSPAAPDCTIVFSTLDENYLVYCRPGDEEWQELHDETDGTYHSFMGSIVSSEGTMYASTDMGTLVEVDVSGVTIEERGIPEPSIMRWRSESHLVESDGEIFSLQFYIHGFYHSEVVDMDIHLLDTTSNVWNKVESIGDRTIFVGDYSVVLSSASRAGVQPGYVHLLHKRCRNGIRLYTIRLDDRTMSCSLLPGSYDSMFWVVPSSFNKKYKESSTVIASESNNEICKLAFNEDVKEVAAPWSNLPLDIVDELVQRLSFIDYFNVRQVCKGWSSITNPSQYTNRYPTYPVLMSICSSSAGSFNLFDPIAEKEYPLTNNSSLAPCKDYFQMLLFAKHGWVLVLRGSEYMFAANPFTGEMLQLPELPWLGYQFDGISFSSTPKSPGCVVFAIEKSKNLADNYLHVMVLHVGDENWTRVKIDDYSPFRAAYSNPVFYHNEFHCLGTRGNLSVFNPENMTWRALDKPNAILDVDPLPGDQFCHLLEFKDSLFAIFRPHDNGPINTYVLDMSQMVWTKVEKLDNEVIFTDNWNAVMVSAPRKTCCNRIYISKFGGYNGDGEANMSVFYDLKSGEYYPDYFSWTERMNSIWVEPKFKCQ